MNKQKLKEKLTSEAEDFEFDDDIQAVRVKYQGIWYNFLTAFDIMINKVLEDK